MITEDDVRDILRNVQDPEVSINVVDLGLIYGVKVDGTHVHIKHTLTSMMCPFAEEICFNIYHAVMSMDGVETVDRELVFDPPFSVEMVPEETRMLMGWY